MMKKTSIITRELHIVLGGGELEEKSPFESHSVEIRIVLMHKQTHTIFINKLVRVCL